MSISEKKTGSANAGWFKKGTTGNPGGRPKGRKNLGAIVGAEMRRRATITENGRRRGIDLLTLFVKRLVADAVKGDSKAREQLLKLLSHIDQRQQGNDVDPIGAAKDDEILARFRAELLSELKGAKK